MYDLQRNLQKKKKLLYNTLDVLLCHRNSPAGLPVKFSLVRQNREMTNGKNNLNKKNNEKTSRRSRQKNLEYSPSHNRLAMFGGKIMCRRLTFFSLSLSTAKFASSIELFSLSILLRRPSCEQGKRATVSNFKINFQNLEGSYRNIINWPVIH